MSFGSGALYDAFPETNTRLPYATAGEYGGLGVAFGFAANIFLAAFSAARAIGANSAAPLKAANHRRVIERTSQNEIRSASYSKLSADSSLHPKLPRQQLITPQPF